MLNIQEGDGVVPIDVPSIFGGDVLAVNHKEGMVTWQAGKSELAHWHTMPYEKLLKFVKSGHTYTLVPIEMIEKG